VVSEICSTAESALRRRVPTRSADPARSLILTLAFGTAASVATIYFNQPLLPLFGRELHAGTHATALLVTVTQLGYGAGIIGVVPLGDVVNKRTLIITKLLLLAVALVAAGGARSMGALLAAHVAIGILSTAAQDFVPLAADLAPAKRRGRIIGTVMSGLLLGILLSRTFSGVVAEHLGWRAVFFSAAGLIALLAVVVRLVVPSRPGAARASYGQLMGSTARLVREYPLLTLATLTQGMLGLVFSAFWTVLAFHLAREFRFTSAQIGTFGLAGAAGALAAPLAGRLADRHGAFFNIPIAIGLVAIAFAAMALVSHSVVALVLGAALFDLGVQMSAVSHQSIVYALKPEARSRMNGIFVGGMFGCFAVGSVLGTSLYVRFGWTGLCVLCLGSCGLAFALHRRTRDYAAVHPLPAAQPAFATGGR
jgi:predicted MFS family arabinose efflux permease